MEKPLHAARIRKSQRTEKGSFRGGGGGLRLHDSTHIYSLTGIYIILDTK